MRPVFNSLKLRVEQKEKNSHISQLLFGKKCILKGENGHRLLTRKLDRFP